MPHPVDDAAHNLTDTLRDALAVVVGLGILGVNRVQAVRRRVREQDRTPAAGEGTPGSGTPPS